MSESVGTAPEAPGPAARDAGGPPPGAGPSRGRAWLASRRRELRFLTLFVVICAVAGAVCAVIWKLTAPVPTITVSNDGSARVSNQALSEFFGADADFMIIGMFGGVALGTLAWHWFKGWGWPVAMVAIVGSALAALITWRLGTLLGPHDFAGRLAGAPGGATIPIDLTLRSATAWLLWPFGATVPVLLYSALGRDEEKDEHQAADHDQDAVGAREAPGPKPATGLTRSGHRLIRFPAFGRH